MKIPENIIVNADDFGYSESVNEAITSAYLEGYINRTTIMVNMPTTMSGVFRAKANDFTHAIGLHLNLTEGYPLTNSMKECDYFVDENGFKGNIRMLAKRPIKRALLRILKKEISAQVAAYYDLGFTLEHLDSHHHVHTELQILYLLESVCRDSHSFKSMRISRNLPILGWHNIPKNIYKLIFNRLIGLYHDTTDYFGSYKDFTAACIKSEKRYEVMLHPVILSGKLVDKIDGGEFIEIRGNYRY